MKKLLKILVSIMVCLVIVGCQKKDDVKLNVSVEKDVVNVGDVFGGNIDFEPKDKIDNYQFGLEYNDELLEFNPDDNTLKALKAGETDIQFYAVNKLSLIHISKSTSVAEFYEILYNHYRQYGVGKYGLNKAFRYLDNEIIPIEHIGNNTLEQLIGYELSLIHI